MEEKIDEITESEAVHEVTAVRPAKRQSSVTSERSEQEEELEGGTPFFPNHFLKEVIAIYIVIGIVLTLAILLPFNLHDKADPLSTPEGIKPEWYFLSVYQALKYFPSHMLIASGKTVAIILVFGVVGFLQIVWPILDNGPQRHPKKRPGGMTIAAIVLFIGILLMGLAIVSDRTIKIDGKQYFFDLRGIPHAVSAQQKPSGGTNE